MTSAPRRHTYARMFPLRDHNPTARTPFVNYALIAANILVFLAYWPLSSDPRALQEFFYTWAIVPAFITEGHALPTLVTSMFLHGGWLHLGGNMLFLHIFGDNLEDQLGHLRYLAFYVVAGIGAGLAQILADPGSTVPLVGASGAIAGVMGGYLLLFPKARVDVLFIIVIIFRIVPIPAFAVLGIWFGIQLFSGAMTPTAGGGVAYWAHAGGFVVGLALILPFWLSRGGPGFWSRTHGHPPNEPATYRRTAIPAVGRAKRRGRTPPLAASDIPKVGRRR